MNQRKDDSNQFDTFDALFRLGHRVTLVFRGDERFGFDTSHVRRIGTCQVTVPSSSSLQSTKQATTTEKEVKKKEKKRNANISNKVFASAVSSNESRTMNDREVLFEKRFMEMKMEDGSI